MQKTKVFEQWLLDQQAIIVRYRQIEKSDVLAEYKQLQTLVESQDFQTKKKILTTTKYVDTPEAKTMAQYKKAKSKGSVLLYRIFHKEAWKEKTEVVEYLQLLEQVNAPEFIKEHAFWKNEKRWFTTPEAAQEKRFSALTKHADIIFYHQHTEKEIAQLESYKLVWKEEFDGAMNTQWATGWVYPLGLKADHSHVSEQQAYTKGANTRLAASVMTIETKKEKVNATAWHPTKGMVMQDFTYTSDVWHSKEALPKNMAVLQAKVAYSGKAKHALGLASMKMEKVLPILHNTGVAGYAIYTLVWTDKEIVTYVNDQEVSRVNNTWSAEEVYLYMRSYLPKNEKAGTGSLNVDWVRVYTR
jgi:hypothetical protein